MKKFIIGFVALSLLFACNHGRTKEEVEKELNEVQTKLGDLQKQEALLKNELDSLSGPRKLRSINVRVQATVPVLFEHKLQVNGAIDAKKSAYISPEMGGKVKQIHVLEGQHVKQGDLLISLNSQSLQSQLSELKSSFKLAETIFRKQKELWDQKIGSEVQFLEAKNNAASLESKIASVEAQIAMTQIKAPFNGIVDEIYVKIGELASPSLRTLDLVNLTNIEVEAEVSEAYLRDINVGDSVKVMFPNFTNTELSARIARKGNIINPANRTFKIVVPIENKQGLFKPNQIASLVLTDYTAHAITLPSLVIRKDLNGSYVFKVAQSENGTIAKKQYVKLGKSYDGKSEILEGLTPSDKVLTEGFSQVRNGSLISIID